MERPGEGSYTRQGDSRADGYALEVARPQLPAWMPSSTGELTPLHRLGAIIGIATLATLVLLLLVWGAHEFTLFIQRMTEGQNTLPR